MTNDWQMKLEEVRSSAERTLNEQELKEFKTRIAILMNELNDKNRQIEQITVDRKEIEETLDRAFGDQSIDIKDQTEEIAQLNDRYARALAEKVGVYEELVKSVKDLTDRNATFMRNEVELCRLKNVTSITKKELEQKEKSTQELKIEIQKTGNTRL